MTAPAIDQDKRAETSTDLRAEIAQLEERRRTLTADRGRAMTALADAEGRSGLAAATGAPAEQRAAIRADIQDFRTRVDEANAGLAVISGSIEKLTARLRAAEREEANAVAAARTRDYLKAERALRAKLEEAVRMLYPAVVYASECRRVANLVHQQALRVGGQSILVAETIDDRPEVRAEFGVSDKERETRQALGVIAQAVPYAAQRLGFELVNVA